MKYDECKNCRKNCNFRAMHEAWSVQLFFPLKVPTNSLKVPIKIPSKSPLKPLKSYLQNTIKRPVKVPLKSLQIPFKVTLQIPSKSPFKKTPKNNLQNPFKVQ
jgi:hypothetical protein